MAKVYEPIKDSAEAANTAANAAKNQAPAALNQASAAEKQASILRGNMRRDGIVPRPFGENGKLIGVGEKLLGWNINPIWTNVGGTDARNFIGWWEIKVVTITEVEKPITPKCPILADVEDKSYTTIVS